MDKNQKQKQKDRNSKIKPPLFLGYFFYIIAFLMIGFGVGAIGDVFILSKLSTGGINRTYDAREYGVFMAIPDDALNFQPTGIEDKRIFLPTKSMNSMSAPGLASLAAGIIMLAVYFIKKMIYEKDPNN